jgi:hypothetical protein
MKRIYSVLLGAAVVGSAFLQTGCSGGSTGKGGVPSNYKPKDFTGQLGTPPVVSATRPGGAITTAFRGGRPVK